MLGLAAALRLYHLGAENLWIDEVFSLGQTVPPLESLAAYYDLDRPSTSRPLSLVLLYFVERLGDSEFLLRLPFAIVSVLDVGAVYLVSRELGGRTIALRAALFLALLPIHVWYAQEVRWYSQWALLTTLSFLALVRLWKTGRGRWWAAHGASLLLALYTFPVSILLAPVHAVAGWLLPAGVGRRAFRIKVLLAVAVVAVAALPLWFNIVFDGGGGSGRGVVGTPRPFQLAALPYLFFAYVAGFSVGPTVGELHDLPAPATILVTHPEVALYFVVFAPIAALGVWSFRERRAGGAVLAPWVIGLPLLVFAVSVLQGQTFNVRYTFPAVSGFALLLALGIEGLGRWRRAGTGVVLALFGFSLFNYYVNPKYDKEDARGAVRFVRASAHADEPVAVVGALAAARHYGEGLEVERLVGCAGVQPSPDPETPQVHATELETETGYWILVSRDWEKRSDRCLAEMMDTHEVVGEREFTGVRLLLLERR